MIRTLTPVSLLCLEILLEPRALCQTPGTPADETFSRNRKFSVEISLATLDKPLISVFEHSGESKKLSWARRLVDKDQNEIDPLTGTPLQMVAAALADPGQIRRIVSDDGALVLLRSRDSNEPQPALRVFTRKGVDKNFTFDDLYELLDEVTESDSLYRDRDDFFEMLLDAEKPPLYTLWHSGSPAQWLVLNLENLTLAKANPQEINRLNSLALPRARELIQAQQPGRLARLLKPVMQKAAEMIPGIVSVDDASDIFESESAYRFLATQKKPEDKKLINTLLEAEGAVSEIAASGPAGMESWVIHSSRERTLGDELLALWDGVSPEEDIEEGSIPWIDSNRPLHLFGRVSGRVDLPFVPPDKSGSIWIYLIPANVPIGQWAREKSVIKLTHSISDGSFTELGDRLSHLNFAYDTLIPGDYRLKAVWDRRAPFTADSPDAVALPAPGDYESSETKPITLAAGQFIRDIALPCTNKVGEASEYYAADDLWKRKAPPTQAASGMVDDESRGPSEKVLMAAPVAQWILRTNELNAGLRLQRIKLLESTSFDSNLRRKVLNIAFTFAGAKADDFSSLRGRLTDEHGCDFDSHGYSSYERGYEISFSSVPLGAKRLEVRISREEFQSGKGRIYQHGPKEILLGAFTLTNLFAVQPEQWKEADVLPARRNLDILSVELPSFDAIAGHPPLLPDAFPASALLFRSRPTPSNEFAFLQNGRPAMGWHKLSGKFADRWGNEAFSIEEFCREEKILKYSVELARDPKNATFLPEEKFEIDVPKVPGPGENLPLQMTKELQNRTIHFLSLSGVGEFQYRDGELLSASKEIAGEKFIPSYLPHRHPRQPKIYFQDNNENSPIAYQPFGRGRQRGTGPVTIASKVPHLVCRFPSLRTDTLIALLEQDTSILEPSSARNVPSGPGSYHHFSHSRLEEHPVKFLPLDLRPGDTNQKLTLIVQKTRIAEFLIKVSDEKGVSEVISSSRAGEDDGTRGSRQ